MPLDDDAWTAMLSAVEECDENDCNDPKDACAISKRCAPSFKASPVKKVAKLLNGVSKQTCDKITWPKPLFMKPPVFSGSKECDARVELHPKPLDRGESADSTDDIDFEQYDFDPELADAEIEFVFRYYKVDEAYAAQVRSMPQHLESGEANPDWLKSRKHRITGSITGSIYGVNKYSNQNEALEQLLRPNFVGNVCTRWGNDNEDNAEAAFVEYLKHEFMGESPSCGRRLVSFDLHTPGLCICTRDGMGMFGMSPDGILDLVWDTGETETVLVEYKCPYGKRRFKDVSKADASTNLYKVERLPGTVTKHGPIPPYYMCQIIFGMGLLKLPRTFFVVWAPAISPVNRIITRTGGAGSSTLAATTKGLIQVSDVPFDEKFYNNKLFPCLERFWRDRYVPDAVKLERGIPVPPRAPPKKKKRARSWFGARSKDAPLRNEDMPKRRGGCPFSSKAPRFAPAFHRASDQHQPPAKRRCPFTRR